MVLATLLEGDCLLFFIKFKTQTSKFKLTVEKCERLEIQVLYSEFGVFSSSLSENNGGYNSLQCCNFITIYDKSTAQKISFN